MRRFGIGCAFVPLLAPFFAACSSSPPVDPSVCETSIVDVPCETDACLPARATRFDGCVPSQGVALTAGPNGTSYLYGANLIATLERDGRGRRDEVLPLGYFALVDRGQPVLFGKQDWKTPPGSPSPFPMTPELTLARHGTSGWTKEQIPVRVRTPVDMFSLDPGFVQRAVARKDGTLHFIVAAGPRQFGGIVTRLPTGIPRPIPSLVTGSEPDSTGSSSTHRNASDSSTPAAPQTSGATRTPASMATLRRASGPWPPSAFS